MRRAQLPYDFLAGDGKGRKTDARIASNVLALLGKFVDLEGVPAPASQFGDAEGSMNVRLIQ